MSKVPPIQSVTKIDSSAVPSSNGTSSKPKTSPINIADDIKTAAIINRKYPTFFTTNTPEPLITRFPTTINPNKHNVEPFI